MSLRQRALAERDALLERWVDAALASYPERSAEIFRRERDPFANPIGAALRAGTAKVLDGLLGGSGPEAVTGVG